MNFPPVPSSDKQPTKLKYLKEVIELISAAFGDLSTKEEQVVYINHLATILRKNDVVMAQIKNNSEDVALKGNLPSAVKTAIIQALSSHQVLSALLLKTDDQAMHNIIKALYKLLKDDEEIDLKQL